MLQRYEAALSAAELPATDHMVTGPINVTIASPRDTCHSEIKT